MNRTHNGIMQLCVSIHLNFSSVKLPKVTSMHLMLWGLNLNLLLSPHFGLHLCSVTLTLQEAQIVLVHVIVSLENLVMGQISV
jgi:hypothetical protein